MPLIWFDSNHSETEPSVLPVLTELGSKHTLQKKKNTDPEIVLLFHPGVN